MTIYTNILTGGSNNHQTTSENANQIQTDLISEGVVGTITNTSGVSPATGAFAVNAQGTPNMTVAVSTGVAYVQATPSGQAAQTLRVYNNASANVTIAANSSGSTKYDWVYASINAANAANPNTAGDNVTTLVTSRSSSASSDDGTPPTYGYPIAVVTVANGASSITNGNIADARNLVVMGVGLATSTLSNPYKFSAYRSTTLSLAAGLTKVTFNTEEYDTGSNFDVATNVGRFTATIAGFYRFSTCVGILTAGNFVFNAQLYKNGSSYKTFTQIKTGSSNASTGGGVTLKLNANDYIEIYAFSGDSGANNANTGQANTWFCGELVSET
jgi:hypothetical protein